MRTYDVSAYQSSVWVTSHATIFQCVKKLVEQRDRIVWSRRGFRMVLNGKDRQRTMAKPFDRAIVEIHMGDSEIRGPFHTID